MLQAFVITLREGLEAFLIVAISQPAGTIAGGVLEIAGRISADLILLASHRPALQDRLMAANAIRIARRASASRPSPRSASPSRNFATVTRRACRSSSNRIIVGSDVAK